MPTNGVFAKVLHGGKISVGDEFHVQYRAAVITLSDTASKGEREDASGAAAEEIVGKEGYEVVFKKIIPDDGDTLTALLCELSDEDKADLILTTGGTGFSQRDNTPEATMRAVEREHRESQKPCAIIPCRSRRGRCSPEACRESGKRH